MKIATLHKKGNFTQTLHHLYTPKCKDVKTFPSFILGNKLLYINKFDLYIKYIYRTPFMFLKNKSQNLKIKINNISRVCSTGFSVKLIENGKHHFIEKLGYGENPTSLHL